MTEHHRDNVALIKRFGELALKCVHQEYPNKVSGHILNSDADAMPPRELTPAFYGCFDWHSSVHGHWLLARIARTITDSDTEDLVQRAKQALTKSLTAANLQAETKYISGLPAFERPYGLAWLLQLVAELKEWEIENPDAREWVTNLQPLETLVVQRLQDWLSKLSYPIRSGEHSQTAFAFGLLLDYSRTVNNSAFRLLLESKSKQFYFQDKNCPVTYEPSGEDFLSPCLAEADVLRRILSPQDYVAWFDEFLPGDSLSHLKPAHISDPSDPKGIHLAGLNLSRAWMLNGITSHLPKNYPRLKQIQQLADSNQQVGLLAIDDEQYVGGHWLGSFAVYLLTKRGLDN
ncbi:unnamed protein product [Didymodactylos carnosus]|uniref:DUF2891 domain-containing protein n=1 Tax=Didymodactylos carnosus TaxID=1234261 RepID=A0A814SI60_9BILA|nr:unnamed protein product [Didymodactylos carnosus]CAF1147678.1 unnamed protein product [Didymodactylos carnosus]CAF3753940.1 unnamed protein product [Didymodactylos carnosus]CAF3911283.1 unnamed protein product [Didymodactylos carnosus]